MADFESRELAELDSISGFLDGVSMVRVAAGLGIAAFGISIVEMEPNADSYPEHDHAPDGLGGEMFAKRPQQLGQEELYLALRGSGTIELDGEPHPLGPETLVRVGAGVRRKVVAGPEGLRLLALGGTPGEAYSTGGTL
jgi:mannose-6-phosphate isomerase-like protein (cupin superfamily)